MHSQCGKYQVLLKPHCECVHNAAHGDSRYDMNHYGPHRECIHNVANIKYLLRPHYECVHNAANGDSRYDMNHHRLIKYYIGRIVNAFTMRPMVILNMI